MNEAADTAPPPIARWLALAIAIAVAVTLMVQTTLNLEPDGTPLVAFALLLRFFTIWSNLAAGLVMGWIAWRGRADERIMLSLVAALAIVALVYWALLAEEHHPVGADWWTNQMFHSAIPLATILWWFAFAHPRAIGWRVLPVVMVWPIAYSVFGLAYGAASGFYPYFFLDRSTLGWGQVLVNMTGLGMLFVAVAAVLAALHRAAQRLRSD